MAKEDRLEGRLDKITRSLGLTKAALNVARGRYQKQHNRQVKNNRKARAAGQRADELRRDDKPKRAARKDAREARLSARADKAHRAASVRLAQVKRLNRKIKGLKQERKVIDAKLAKLIGKVTIEGNKVQGGSPEDRLQAALLRSAENCVTGVRENFYSQAGRYSAQYAITGEPRGFRSDCSQFGASIYFACGLEDPNNTNYSWGWTGTLAINGRPVSREYARTHAGCAVLWSGHVEWSLGDGTEHTVGHGSAPVDLGTFDLLPGPQFRAYV